MTDFSVQSSKVNEDASSSQVKNDEYSRLKKRYEQIKQKIEGSDFANSPTGLEKELQCILKLKQVAEDQGLTEEVAKLSVREQEIYTKLSSNTLLSSPNVYYRPIMASKIPEDDPNTEEKYSRFGNFFEQNFSNLEEIQQGIENITAAGVADDAAVRILNALKVTNRQTNISTINPDAMKYVAQMKNILARTRNNESMEYHNPINHLNETKVTLNDSTFIFKDGKLIYATPIEGEHRNINDEYENALKKEEDKFLYDFVCKYKSKTGEIDNKYIRLFTLLNSFGITKESMFDIIDTCIDDNGNIKKDTLAAIKSLKESDILSKDVKAVIEQATNPETGKIDSRYINLAKSLTEAILTGADVINFIAESNGNEEAENFIINFSNIYEAKSVQSLIDLVKDNQGVMNSNAMDIVNALYGNTSMKDENGDIKAEQLVKISAEIINMTKDSNNLPDESATELVFKLCQNGNTIDEIRTVLKECMDSNNIVDYNLAKIAWHMLWEDEDIELIIEMLNNCRTNGRIDFEKSYDMLNLFGK